MSSALSDKTIRSIISSGFNIVEPFDENSLQPASIDLKLGNIHYKYKVNEYILGEYLNDEIVDKEEFEELHLKHGEIAFIGINEKISIPQDTIGIIFPRSSITRLGIQIITTYMNPGYVGNMPLTIINHSRMEITLKPGYRVAQLVLISLTELPDINYKERTNAKYYNEKVDYSKLHTDKELEEMMDEILKQETPVLYKMMKT